MRGGIYLSSWEETENKACAEGTISDCSEVGFPVSEESNLPPAGGEIQSDINEVNLVTQIYIKTLKTFNTNYQPVSDEQISVTSFFFFNNYPADCSRLRQFEGVQHVKRIYAGE